MINLIDFHFLQYPLKPIMDQKLVYLYLKNLHHKILLLNYILLVVIKMMMDYTDGILRLHSTRKHFTQELRYIRKYAHDRTFLLFAFFSLILLDRSPRSLDKLYTHTHRHSHKKHRRFLTRTRGRLFRSLWSRLGMFNSSFCGR